MTVERKAVTNDLLDSLMAAADGLRCSRGTGTGEKDWTLG